MITDEIKYQIIQQFGFEPTAEQDKALTMFANFLTDRGGSSVMILRGSAGTGKTSLAGAIVRAMVKMQQKVMLLAPTGRAAKVFSVNSGHPAYTIHRRIYREQAYTGLDGSFNLNNNRYQDMLFMVDEASMISQKPLQSGGKGVFGSGSLLDDLVKFVYSGKNDKMLLIGDKAQLPPIGELESPALIGNILAGYGLKVYECDLNEVLRQGQESGILYNATLIRNLIADSSSSGGGSEQLCLPKIKFDNFADIVSVPGNELIETLYSSYSDVGIDETMVITRSNKRANIYNQGIRNTVLDREDILATDDMLMVVKNNYYWTEKEGSLQSDTSSSSRKSSGRLAFIANGDRARVVRVHNNRELYGFHFADVEMEFPDYDDFNLDVTVILDCLTTDTPSLTREQSEQLYNKVMEDYADIPLKKDRLNSLRQDDYFNALQVKFAYAITCHKAQGGQWSHVYVDQGYMTEDMITPDYIHWLYTAFTRATDKLFLVNWPTQQTETV